MQGLRIDYVLVSPDVFPDVGVCHIVDTPHKWSDHAALMIDIRKLQPPRQHEPISESSKRMKRFDKRQQRSIASMFAGRKPPCVQAQASQPAASVPKDRATDALTRLDAPEPVSPLKERKSGAGREHLGRKRAKREAEGIEALIREEAVKGANGEGHLSDLPLQDASVPQLNSVHKLSAEESRVSSLEMRSVARNVEKLAREKGQQGIKAFFSKAPGK